MLPRPKPGEFPMLDAELAEFGIVPLLQRDDVFLAEQMYPSGHRRQLRGRHERMRKAGQSLSRRRSGR